MEKAQSSKESWLIWATVVLFYFYQYFLRVCPSVLVTRFEESFSIDASGIGALSSFYFYLYGLMQIPAGYLLDKAKTHVLLFCSIFICALGTILMGCSSSLGLAYLGRSLQGIGSSFSFLGLIYVSAHYFSPLKLGFLISLGDSIGKIGGVLATTVFTQLLKVVKWETSFIFLGGFGIFLAIASYFLIKKSHKIDEANPKSTKPLKTILKTLIKQKPLWAISILSAFMALSLYSFGGLWGTTFLEVGYRYTPIEAGYATSLVFFGSVFGGPLLGHLAARYRASKKILLFSCIFAALTICSILYTTLPWVILLIFLFLVGFFSSSQNLTYSVAIEGNCKMVKGSVSGFLNLFVFMLGAVSQYIVGFLLEYHSTLVFKSSKDYSLSDFKFACFLFPFSFFIAFLIGIFLFRRKREN